MIRNCCFFVAILIAFLFSGAGYCQSDNDSVFLYKAIKNIKADYFSTIKEKAHLYNGIDYAFFGRGVKGSPFFADTMYRGSVFYDGVLYEDALIRYDMVNDVLLVKHFTNNNTLELIKNKVDYFSIPGHQFITFNADGQNKNKLSGFFELLYKGKKTFVIAKRYKKLLLSLNSEDRAGTFVQYSDYFIYKDEKYSSVNSENALLKIFEEKAPEIKKFMRTGKVKYKKDPEQAIVSAALFYNGLTQ